MKLVTQLTLYDWTFEHTGNIGCGREMFTDLLLKPPRLYCLELCYHLEYDDLSLQFKKFKESAMADIDKTIKHSIIK